MGVVDVSFYVTFPPPSAPPLRFNSSIPPCEPALSLLKHVKLQSPSNVFVSGFGIVCFRQFAVLLLTSTFVLQLIFNFFIDFAVVKNDEVKVPFLGLVSCTMLVFSMHYFRTATRHSVCAYRDVHSECCCLFRIAITLIVLHVYIEEVALEETPLQRGSTRQSKRKAVKKVLIVDKKGHSYENLKKAYEEDLCLMSKFRYKLQLQRKGVRSKLQLQRVYSRDKGEILQSLDRR